MREVKNETINQRIKRYRKLCHLTQHKVAELLGMKNSTYSQAEREGNVTCELLIKISSILGVDVKVLLFGEEDGQEIEINPTVIDNPNYMEVTDKERRIITMYRNFNQETKNELYAFLNEKFKR